LFMDIVATFTALKDWRSLQHGTVALVPTMGALHSGHMALVDYAKTLADTVVVSIYVNPTQFAPNEDFTQYPRTFEADCDLCQAHGVSAIYVPTDQFLFPQGLQTAVTPPAWLTEAHCGLIRPGHFTGVATVVLKLFMLVQPSVAVFGEKDAQQLAVIRHMVQDLHVPVAIKSVPTQR
jgi:pantoate--beta-alanine ligase